MPATPTPTIDAQILHLMSLYDEAFLEKAYQVILGRAPDESGLANYLPKVRSGVHRGHIILELAESEEGRSKRSDLPAIRASFGKFRDPDPGPMKLAFRRVFGNPGTSPARQQRAVENQLHSLQQSMAALRSQQAQLLKAIQEIASRFGRATSTTSSDFDEDRGIDRMMPRLPPRISRTVQDLKAAIARKRNKQ
jgi:hypothetical protein